MILVGGDNLQVIGAEFIGVDFLNAVDEFDWGSVTVFGKKGDCGLSGFDGFEDVADGLVYK